MPRHLTGSTVVPLGESFLLVGGSLIEDAFPKLSKTIYKYEKLSDSWTLFNATLPHRAGNPVVLMVDIDIFPSCYDEVESGASSIQGHEIISLTCLFVLFACMKHFR